jgi:hypothetical protein
MRLTTPITSISSAAIVTGTTRLARRAHARASPSSAASSARGGRWCDRSRFPDPTAATSTAIVNGKIESGTSATYFCDDQSCRFLASTMARRIDRVKPIQIAGCRSIRRDSVRPSATTAAPPTAAWSDLAGSSAVVTCGPLPRW